MTKIQSALFEPKGVSMPTQYHPGVRIIGTQVPRPEGTPVDKPEQKPMQYVNTAAAVSGGPGPKPTILDIDSSFQPSTGVYIMTGPSEAGKTILSLSLVSWINDICAIPATYVPCFEPRASETIGHTMPKARKKGKERAVSEASAFASITALFRDPLEFVNDIERCIIASAHTKLIIFDSATLPLKAFASTPPYRHQATFPGGAQPSDRGFLERVGTTAYACNACIILNINSQIVPGMREMIGAVEGLITPRDIASFMVRDRTKTTARTREKTIKLPIIPYVQAALDLYEYGPYRGATALFPQDRYAGL